MQTSSSAARSRLWGVRPWVTGVGLFVAVLTMDALLEGWARESLTAPICATSWMCLAVQYNSGLFLGMVTLESGSAAWALHWLMVPPVLAWLCWRVLTLNSGPLSACYALVTGGLVGNLTDRAVGGVVDYVGIGPVIDGRWVFMNLADVALVAGVVWLGMLLLWRRWRRHRRRA